MYGCAKVGTKATGKQIPVASVAVTRLKAWEVLEVVCQNSRIENKSKIAAVTKARTAPPRLCEAMIKMNRSAKYEGLDFFFHLILSSFAKESHDSCTSNISRSCLHNCLIFKS